MYEAKTREPNAFRVDRPALSEQSTDQVSLDLTENVAMHHAP